MQILNFGSLNIDHVYAVEHFARAGETLDTSDYRVFAGGKGFNQSIALARAGARVAHAGQVGDDGRWLIDELADAGADVRFVAVSETPTGHAVIQVLRGGENSILIHGGANRTIGEAQMRAAIEAAEPGCFLLIQNEINGLDRIMEIASQKGLPIVLNPSPVTSSLMELPLEKVGTFILNEVEARLLSAGSGPAQILDGLRRRFPEAAVVLTRGECGVEYADPSQRETVSAERVEAVDTTGAGDTFAGYFLAERLNGAAVEDALRLACRAAAVCVQRPGAAASIPRREEIA
jgi:ribokinase